MQIGSVDAQAARATSSAPMRWRPVDLRTNAHEPRCAGDPADIVDAAAELLEALLKRPAWHAQAACRGQGHERWFPTRGNPATDAKAICAGCPVQEPCLAAAMAEPLTVGIWGGTTGKERRRMHQGRPAATPKGDAPRRQPVPAAALVAFVDETPGQGWPQRLRRWNQEHPERPFPTPNAMGMAWRYVRGREVA